MNIQVPRDKMIPMTLVFSIVRGIILSRGTCTIKCQTYRKIMLKEFVLMSFCLKKSFVALGVADKDVVGGEVPVHGEASVIGVRSTDLLGLGEA